MDPKDDNSRCFLVTSGAGYADAHGYKALASAGYRTTTLYMAMNRPWSGDRLGAATSPAAAASTRSSRGRGGGVDAFRRFCLCWGIGLRPGKYYSYNVGGTLTLLEVLLARGVDKLVFSLICATYGEPARVPITEDEPQSPINPYGWLKLMVE